MAAPIINNTGRTMNGILFVPWTTKVSFYMVVPQYVCDIQLEDESEYSGWNLIIHYTAGPQLPKLRTLEVSRVLSNHIAIEAAIKIRNEIQLAFKQFKPYK